MMLLLGLEKTLKKLNNKSLIQEGEIQLIITLKVHLIYLMDQDQEEVNHQICKNTTKKYQVIFTN